MTVHTIDTGRSRRTRKHGEIVSARNSLLGSWVGGASLPHAMRSIGKVLVVLGALVPRAIAEVIPGRLGLGRCRGLLIAHTVRLWARSILDSHVGHLLLKIYHARSTVMVVPRSGRTSGHIEGRDMVRNRIVIHDVREPAVVPILALSCREEETGRLFGGKRAPSPSDATATAIHRPFPMVAGLRREGGVLLSIRFDSVLLWETIGCGRRRRHILASRLRTRVWLYRMSRMIDC